MNRYLPGDPPQMLFNRSRKTTDTGHADDRSRLADLEAAQRRDVYAAGRPR